NGFVIQLPSESPIPTPTVYDGRLYVSGGFSSEEYYCFDAQCGKLEWAVQLDDDGPSSATPFEDSILFSCESCTLFALDAKSGAMRWSHWLGDPLLSMPAVAGREVFAVYPATPDEDLPEDAVDGNIAPSHIVAAFDAATGKLRWRRWIDSDCMTTPVVAGDDLYLTSLTGTLYRFGRKDGAMRLAERVRATSAPVAVGERVYLGRRADDPGAAEVMECITAQDRATNALQYAAARHAAPYLDQAVQREAAFSQQAEEFEAPNAIGGGFGGSGGGFFSVPPDAAEGTQADGVSDESVAPAKQTAVPADEVLEEAAPFDALAVKQLQAADVIGLGNVSTLQAFHGSRPLSRDGRLFSCMGDRLVCLNADSGEVLWTVPLEGDLRQAGGHLATPPIAAGNHLLIATITGQLRLIDPSSGRTERTWDVGSPVRFPPVVDAGRIFVGTQDGKLVCIETGDAGLTGWSMPGGDPGHNNSVTKDANQP
nr:PQQ-like beta-propeller repeat protein [Planctomycetota bacterium]